MKARLLVQRRIIVAIDAVVDLVVWQVPEPVDPARHAYKYRLAYVVRGQCVLRYDNERGKGDHRHTEQGEGAYPFTTPDRLMADFAADVERWNHEHGRA